MKFIASLFICTIALAGDTTHSSVFKQPFKYSNSFSIVRPSEVTYHLWEGFSLVRKANSGDPEAQHELGIRYLAGQGFSPDTLKAFELLLRAADNGHLLALFNIGVFFHNGWGVEWDPFQAFKYFRSSAQKGTREGAFALSLFYTDNLTVDKDLHQSYRWMKISAEMGYPPAKELLPEIERYKDQLVRDSVIMLSTPQTVSGQPQLMPLSFDSMDDAETLDDSTNTLKEILLALGEPWKSKLNTIVPLTDSLLFAQLLRHAEWGVPEEFTIIGRCYEQGIGVPRDSMRAILAYLRAVRLESRRAPEMLIRLLENESLIRTIQAQASRGDPEAQYIVACFSLTGIYPSPQHDDIVKFLQQSAQQSFAPAITELGTAYFSGQIVAQEKRKAIDLWHRSAILGSHEALVKISSAKIVTGYGEIPVDSAHTVLYAAMGEGSINAQLAVAFSYETGIGFQKKLSEAVKLYRLALQRGSRSAYASLQRMYDARRPADEPEFRINRRSE
ncbi:MAG: tetratricopeptide repeat protein [Bacteroidota bacterium]